MNQTEVNREQLKRKLLLKKLKEKRTPIVPKKSPTIPRADRTKPVPLSWSQQRLWFLSQLDNNVREAYHIPYGLNLRGSLNKLALVTSLNKIIERHEVLRTVFELTDGEPRQRIKKICKITLPEYDLSELAGDSLEEEIERHTETENSLEFNLEQGPLIRGRLLKIRTDEYRLLLTVHHIVSDAWSEGILMDELMSFYGALVVGEAPVLKELPVQYADYALWQRTWLQGETLTSELNFWKEQLDGAPTLLELPLDYPRPALPNHEGARVNFTLDPDLSRHLQEFSQRHGVTLYMTLYTAWVILLSRLSGQTDIVVGTPAANRSRAEIERLIGFFVNTLAIRTDIGAVESVKDLLQLIKKILLDAYSHQDVPFEQVVETLKPERSLSYSPIFQTIFTLENTPEQEFDLPGLTIETAKTAEVAVQFDLGLSLEQEISSNAIKGDLEFAQELFNRSTIERWSEHYRLILSGMLENENQSIKTLGMLSPHQRRKVTLTFNYTSREFPNQTAFVHELIEEHAQRRPEALAVQYNEEALSYAELNTRANQVAHYLVKAGVKPDDIVAISVERSVERIVGVLGILKAGAAYIPVDPTYPAQRIAFMLTEAKPRILLAHSSLADKLPADGVEIAPLDDPDHSVFAMQPETNILRQETGLRLDHLAYVIYTSGSTGRPKGILLEHRGLTNLALLQKEAFTVQAKSRVLQFASFSFDVFAQEFTLALCAGASLHLASQEQLLPGDPLLKLLLDREITHAMMPPVALSMLPEHPLKNLDTIIVGGETCKPDLARLWSKNRTFINIYGPSEATVVSTFYTHTTGDPVSLPIGKPVANSQIYILDEHLQPVPLGVEGEIYIGGIGVARGYLDRDELNRERFIQNPFADIKTTPRQNSEEVTPPVGARIYKTGDLGRWLEDGNIEYRGRNDHQVKIRGFRIELGEIEARLKQCVSVREAVVLAREDVPGDKRLTAYFTQHPGIEADIDAIRTELGERLPNYMVPGAFVLLDEMPLTPNGKLDRQGLPQPDAVSTGGEAYEEPVGPIENAIAAIWRTLLRVDRVGRNDHFFKRGGHSLLAVQLVSRLQKELGRQPELREIFERPRLRDFAQALQETAPEDTTAIPWADRTLPLPLSFSQQRLWFIDQLDKNAGRAYHIPVALKFTGNLNPMALRRALTVIVARHESLRTVFDRIGDEPVQVVNPVREFALPVVDISDAPAGKREQLKAELIEAETRAPFDLTRGPLIRGRLIKRAANEHILLITLHHIVTDGWSMGILTQELSVLYREFADKGDDYADFAPDQSVDRTAHLLPPLPLQYADFAQWQRAWLRGERLDGEVNYWKTRLADAPALLELPLDRSRPAIQDYAGASVNFDLSRELSASLKNLAVEEDVTLFMVLFVGWVILLNRLSGQDDIVVGTPVANRRRTELEGLIGFFVNTLALRIDVGDNPTVADLLSRVKDTALSAFSHQDLPFEQIVEMIQPERSLSHSPLVQVMFSLDNENESPEMFGLEIAEVVAPEIVSKFDLSVTFQETEGRIQGSIDYATALFHEATIKRWTNYLIALFASMTEKPSCSVKTIPFMDAAEMRQILEEYNPPRSTRLAAECIHQLFEAHAARNPDAVALVQGEQVMSYGRLNRAANQLAHFLLSQDIGPDSLVALCLERSPALIVAIMGILKAGGAYVPVDLEQPQERIKQLLTNAKPALILTQDRESASRIPPIEDARVTVLRNNEALAKMPVTNIEPDRLGLAAYHLAYVMYTSGSTGEPKGVMVEHRQLVNYMATVSRLYGWKSEDRVLQFAALSFDISVEEIFGALGCGATLVLRTDEWVTDSETFWKLCRRAEISIMHLPTAFWHQMIPDDSQWISASVRQVVIGGEKVNADKISQWFELDGHLPELINSYGPTETTVTATYHRVLKDDENADAIGRPIINASIYILDERGQPVPNGVRGEIYIGGYGVARGYLNAKGLTKTHFLELHVGGKRKRLYKTGDLGRWLKDGYIAYLGRNDEQVKIRGFRIEPREIESRINQIDEVREAIVLVRDMNGANSKQIHAYVTTESTVSDSLKSSIVRQLKSHLPDYMIPQAMIYLDEFPLSLNGKVNRKALPLPDETNFAGTAYMKPVGAIERSMANIWQGLLGVSKVGRNDNFFELGGHSLLAVRLIGQLKEIGLTLPLSALFKNPTIKALAESLDQEEFVETKNPLRLNPQTGKRTQLETPLFLVHEVSGDLQGYQPLTRELESLCPLYGLQLIDSAGHAVYAGEQIRSVESIAASHILALKQVQPSGPYRIAGWSMGGTVAYEIVNQLLGQNEAVEFLGLIDTLPQVMGEGAGEGDARDFLFEGLQSELGDGVDFTPIIFQLDFTSENALIDDEMRQRLFTREDTRAALRKLEQIGLNSDEFIDRLNTAYLLYRADTSYCLQPLNIEAHLFRATIDDGDNGLKHETMSQNWQPFLKNLNEYQIAGNHTSIMQSPQVQSLGQTMRQALLSVKPANSPAYAQRLNAGYNPIVTMQVGNRSQPPLFCIPGAGASMAGFLPLCRELDDAAPVYCLQPRGLESDLVPFSTVSAAASSYIEAIEQAKLRPTAFRLLGHSFGGWIALEMARQLISMGGSVEPLVLLDTPPPARPNDSWAGRSRMEGLQYLMEILEQQGRGSLGIDASEMKLLSEEQQLGALVQGMIALGLLPADAKVESIRGMVRVFLANMNTRYVLSEPYQGEIFLAYADENARQDLPSEWKKHAMNITSVSVPANHMQILETPGIRKILSAVPCLRAPAEVQRSR
ncbi:MAG: amino acid adenylation domain-containing protein [Proteobacteria bacterium]|nr:amino acid adenylation domain-containing protein [Pseudomonadota bacterium]